MSRIKRSGGFVFAEFAMALPLLILLFYGLATVGLQIFHLVRIQLADYVLEEEVHDVLSRLIYDARAAKYVDLSKPLPSADFTYRTINEIKSPGGGKEVGDVIADKEEPRVYILKNGKIYYERVFTLNPRNPITGDNYFGETRVVNFRTKKLAANVLHITLEMQSEISGHKIKISTAVYMPGCDD